ncbi:hypothetical protein POM88_003929 [Heracleum sosnowskyi]|uniref:Rx N-terminal domain-containing protein n=1 Tax=Heracleum sosnowskyi TaxID=360622 RepID=A0AAD8JIV9_9APIA|nr:hypothetical protein POM88_003929 [Heracleum sosnowskyi]
MAEYIVAFVLDKIAGYLIEEAGSFSRIDVQVEWIEAELRRMQCFLKDAEMKQNGDERVQNWVCDVRDIAYDTDDLIDFCILKVSQPRSGFLYFLKKFTFFNDLLFRRKVNKHIDRIKKRIVHVKDSRSTYGIENLRIGTQMTSFSGNGLNEKRRSFPYTNEDDIVGLEEDIEALMSRLIHGDCRRSVISIIGVKFGSISRARRLAIHSGLPIPTMNVKKIRSLLFFNHYEYVPLDLKKFKLLRILDLEGVQIAQLGSAIGDLAHLRYLSLRETWLKNLPSSVGCLSNLQTLDLRSTLIDPIPLAIWKLQQLRHLHFSKFKAMVVSPPYNTSLPNLHTLQGICLCESSCIQNGLDNLVNLRELGLYGDLHLHEEEVSRWIHLNKNLEELKIQSSNNFAYVRNAAIPKLMSFSSHIRLYKLHFEGIISKVLDIKEFPPNLTELSLEESFLKEDPMPILEKLPSLRVLKMKQASFLGKELVCSSGGFPQLQYLKFSFLTFTTWTIEDGALSNLRQLEIVECNRLKIVPKGLRPVTTLRELKLGFMPVDMKSKVQDRQGENWYKIQQVLPI